MPKSPVRIAIAKPKRAASPRPRPGSPRRAASPKRASTAWCMRCKSTHTMRNPVKSVSVTGTKLLKGVCSKCGGRVCRLMGK